MGELRHFARERFAAITRSTKNALADLSVPNRASYHAAHAFGTLVREGCRLRYLRAFRFPPNGVAAMTRFALFASCIALAAVRAHKRRRPRSRSSGSRRSP